MAAKTILIAAFLCMCVAGAAEAKVTGSSYEYEQGGTVLEGWVVRERVAGGARPGVLIVHQWRGLSDYEKKLESKLKSKISEFESGLVKLEKQVEKARANYHAVKELGEADRELANEVASRIAEIRADKAETEDRIQLYGLLSANVNWISKTAGEIGRAAAGIDVDRPFLRRLITDIVARIEVMPDGFDLVLKGLPAPQQKHFYVLNSGRSGTITEPSATLSECTTATEMGVLNPLQELSIPSSRSLFSTGLDKPSWSCCRIEPDSAPPAACIT